MAGRLVAELKAFVTPGPRMVDEIECAASVLLAIVAGHLLGARNISWAAFSGYMVMRGHVAESLRRGFLRIVGTVVGAILAVAFVETAGTGPFETAPALALVGGAMLYAALTSKSSYAWLFVGLTFAMIVMGQVERPAQPLHAFAVSRVVEVFAGTAACVLVSLVSTLSLRRRWPAPRRPDLTSAGWRPEAARHAGQGALALALLPLVHLAWPAPQLAQAAIAIMAVMLVPVGGIGASALQPVTLRILWRIAGCAVGASFAASILLISHGSEGVLLPAALIGVMIGRHIENGPTSMTYAGTQFTLAALVTLVPDNYAAPDLRAGWERLAGTLVGITLLEPVLLAWHFLAPRRPAGTGAQRSEPGDI
jgi:uncharacterized membrane protein YccC